MFKKISILTKLIPTARTVIFNSQRTMQTNYGDYVRFLELVGNVKVSELLVTDNLNENKNKKKNISRSSTWDFTCDDDIWLMVNRRGLEFLLIMNIPCFIFFTWKKCRVRVQSKFQRDFNVSCNLSVPIWLTLNTTFPLSHKALNFLSSFYLKCQLQGPHRHIKIITWCNLLNEINTLSLFYYLICSNWSGLDGY